jgi:hypothetical protein
VGWSTKHVAARRTATSTPASESMPSNWSAPGTPISVLRWRPKRCSRSMPSRWSERPCAGGWSQTVYGCHASRGAASISCVLRRESYGELIQIDGSEYRWFENRGAPCSLLVFVDDATSKLMQRRFVPSESTSSYFECLREYLEAPWLPCCLLLGQALGLPSLFDNCERNFSNRRVRDPYARWCSRGQQVTAAPMPIKSHYGEYA